MSDLEEIIFDELAGHDGSIGLITLNKQQVLNALNHKMFLMLDKKIGEWADASHIKAVVIKAAEGRAFCAGGDIRYVYELRKKNDPTIATFFHDEYRMNRRIHHFPKPYIAMLDGITMGGGVGISLHGSNRIGTERLTFAMPETGIGFYPDVGTTYCLARMPSNIGFYLGLTGMRISYADCLAIGIVQQIVKSDSFEGIIDKLVHTPIRNKDSVMDIVKAYELPLEKSPLFEHKHAIELCFAKDSVEEILVALNTFPSEWCHQTAEIISKKSPTSLKVTLRALQEARKLSFDACMKMEYRLTSRFVQGHDFFEGVRAVIVDKDQRPKWQPDKLSNVTLHDIASYFSPLEKELV